MRSKTVEQFKIGDKISIYGYVGIVVDKEPEIRDGVKCTYLKVNFDNNNELAKTAYNGGWYGGNNEIVAYGYIE